MSLPLCFSQTELLDGRDLALYSLVPIPNTVCGAEALSKYPLTVKQVKEMGSTCHECRAVGYVLHLLALPYSVVMSVDACQEGGGRHRERGGGHGEARSGGCPAASSACRWLAQLRLAVLPSPVPGGMFPREQESFSSVCGPDGHLSVEVLPTSSVQSCLAFGIDKVNNSWRKSVKPIG